MQVVGKPDSMDVPAAIGPWRVLDRWLGHVVTASCVLLLAAKVVLLLIGVIARYVFQAPQVWALSREQIDRNKNNSR
jgi:hypothetical protein